MDSVVLGIDIGGTHVRAGLVDAALSIRAMTRTPSSSIQGPDAPDRLSAFIRTQLAQWGARPRTVAIGFPSAIDRARRVLLRTPNMEGYSGIDIVSALEHRLGMRVLVERDVNLLFRYDRHVLGLAREGVTLGVYVGTGIGNVIAVDGEILLGQNGVAAELGHVRIPGQMRPCSCGGIGCAETLVSGWRLNELRLERHPDTPIAELFARHAGEQPLTDFVDAMARVIAMEATLMDPAALVLGGGVIHMPGFPVAALEAGIRACLVRSAQGVRIAYARASDESGIIGAALYAGEMS